MKYICRAASSSLAVICALLSFSQDEEAASGLNCGTTGLVPDGVQTSNCSETGSDWINTYRHKEHWVPDPVLTPLKILHVNFEIWQEWNGTGNLDDTPANRARLQQIIQWVNDMYEFNPTATTSHSYPVTYIPDSRIRVVLDNIYFYQDPSGTAAQYCVGNYYGHNQLLDGYLDQNYPERTRALNLHLVIQGTSGYAGYSDYGSIESYYRTNPPMNTNNVHDYWYAQHLAHEIGHAFDLWHTYNSGWGQNCPWSLDYLWDVFDQTNTSCGACSCLLTGHAPDNYLMGGGEHKSAMQMGIIQRSTVMENFNNYNYGIRDHVVGYSTIPWEVTADETWDFSMKFYQDLVVKPGVTLTVKCELQFVPEAGIIVEPGGRLIVDGGKLTSEWYYQQQWRGIEVWGDNTQDQYPFGHPTHQGMVVLMNGATIEHAHEALNMLQPGVWGTFGGVVQATDANFINCRRSAQFLQYQNTSLSGTAIRNFSSFTRCHFTVDDNYQGPSPFAAHVTMWQVDGIRIQACDFRNDRTDVTESDELGCGIISLDAKYSVLGQCSVLTPWPTPCPDPYYTPSTFVGLDHGIHAMNGGTDRAFTVDRCVFENNICGVFASGMTNYSVTRNHFMLGHRNVTLVGPEDTYFDDAHRGVFSYMSSGFRIEENDFQTDADANAPADAIVVSASKEHNDVVYKNTASNMRNAYIGEGPCMDPANAYTIGLQFLCNINQGNQQDIWERQVPALPNPLDHSIRTQQGDPALSAGNLFDQEVSTMDESDFRNNTFWALDYWHHGGTSEPVDISGTVYTYLSSAANTCPTNFTNIHQLQFSGDAIAEVLQHFAVEKDTYISTEYEFNSLLDGGNTEDLVQQVQASSPDAPWELYEQLMNTSPFLSTTVLKEMILHNTLPQPMVLEVCVANPEATRQEGFVDWARYEAPDPLPDDMIDQIAASWQERTFRQELQASMAQHHASMSQDAYAVLGHLKNDTITEPTDSLLLIWHDLPNFGARMAEAMTLVQTGAFDQAREVMELTRQEYPMRSDRAAEVDRLESLIGFLQSVASSGRTVLQLSDEEVSELAAISGGADDGSEAYDRPSTWAWNILCFGYGQCRPTPSGGEQHENRAFRPVPEDAPAEAPPLLSVQPNPAGSFTVFQFTLPVELEQGVLVVHDALGRELDRLPVSGREGQLLWDTRRAMPGTYSVELINDGQRAAFERFVVKP